MKFFKKITLIITVLQGLVITDGVAQQLPQNPVLFRIFTPFVINPAIAGSKDFASVDLLFSKIGKSGSQMLNTNFRVAKSPMKYFSSIRTNEYSNFGAGGYLFNEISDKSRNTGIAGSLSYHFPLDKEEVSFVSVGVTAKAIFNNYAGDPDIVKPPAKTFFPNADAGVYYYNSRFNAGISVTNLLGNPDKPDSLGLYTINVTRQYYLNVAYKFVISRSMNLVLEPFLIINADDSFSGNLKDMLKPGLKFYAENFCIGTFFNDFDKVSFFLQYKYSKMYLGVYFGIPVNSAFYKEPILAEFSLGINLSSIRSGFSKAYHW